MRFLRTLSLTLAATLLVVSGAMAGPGHDHGSHAAMVGKAAPDFTLTDHTGKSHKLSDYQGKIVVLEWVNPECPFVKRHYDAGTMKNLSKHYEGKDVVWLAVNSTKHFDQAMNAKFVKDRDLSFAVLDDHSGDVGRMYGAKTTPHMYVVDAKGMLVYNGAIDNDPRGNQDEVTNFVAAAVDNVLAGEAVANASNKPYGCSVKYADPAKAAVKESTSR